MHLFAAAVASALALAPAPAQDLATLVPVYDADRQSVRRFFNVPWSEDRLGEMDRLGRAWRQRLARIDFDALDQHGRIDWVLLRNHLDAGEAERDLERRRLAEMEELLPFRDLVIRLERLRWDHAELDLPALAGELSGLPETIKAVRERVEKGRKAADAPQDDPQPAPSEGTATEEPAPVRVSPVLARRAAGAVAALRGTLWNWHGYYDPFVPGFSWWIKAPYDEAIRALDDYAKYLREDIAGQKGEDEDPLVGDPIGRESLLADLAHEFIAYSPEELIAIAEREFAWCEDRMREAAADMGRGDDWMAALAEVKDRHVPPGEQPAYAAAQAREAIEFLKERDLITIPPLAEDLWRTGMIAPEHQKFWPFAVYNFQHYMVSYPAASTKHADKLMSMRGNNAHFSRIVAAHEMIPGHHLQLFMADRFRPYRQTFSTPFFVEGWALYWEMTLWDEDFARGPEDRVGMLFWRMHRAARIIVSLKFHLGEMTPQEMIDFLVDRVGHERFTATSEVRRFIGGDYSPLYQVAYMIGGLQIRALRGEAVGPGRMSLKEFHDRLLLLGSIPIELVRAELLGLDVHPEMRASWRFMD